MATKRDEEPFGQFFVFETTKNQTPSLVWDADIKAFVGGPFSSYEEAQICLLSQSNKEVCVIGQVSKVKPA